MRKALIDTDILSEFLKGRDPRVTENGLKYLETFDRLTYSSVTLYELVRGLEEKGSARQVEKVLDWLKANEEIVPASEDYLKAAQIKAQARRIGRTVELPDCLIACSAARLGLSLITGNTSDFQAIQAAGLDLTIENWRDEAPAK